MTSIICLAGSIYQNSGHITNQPFVAAIAGLLQDTK